MRWSFHLARIAGIDVRVHATFFLLLAFWGITLYLQGGPVPALLGVLVICLIFLCVLLHEFGHAFAARHFGIQTPDITLLPIGGVARLERMPEKPSEEIVVAIAGPLVNVAILGVLAPFIDWSGFEASLLSGRPGLVEHLFVANAALVLFNLIPAFPMDGGRVLRALLATRMDYARATALAASIGQTIAVAGGLYGLLSWNPMLVLVAVFIFVAAQGEAAHVHMRNATSGLRVRDAIVTRFETLPRNSQLHHAVDALLHTSQHDFPIVDEAGAVSGLLTRADLVVALRKTGPDTPVAEVMRTGVPCIPAAMLLDRAFAVMQEYDTPALPVLDSAGRVVGLFTRENVGELMMIQSALAERPPKEPAASVRPA